MRSAALRERVVEAQLSGFDGCCNSMVGTSLRRALSLYPPLLCSGLFYMMYGHASEYVVSIAVYSSTFNPPPLFTVHVEIIKPFL